MDPELPAQQAPSYGSIGEPLSRPAAYTPAPPMGGGGKLILRAVIGFIMLVGLLFALWKAIPLLLPVSEEKVVLTYWGLHSDEEAMRQVLTEFTQENPNISVEYIKQDPKQYRDRLLARIGNGTGPDLFRFHNTWTTPFASLLLPLSSDVISTSSLKNDYYPVVEKDLLRNGAVMGLPLQIDTLALFTNTEIFRAAGIAVPGSWDDFIKASRQLTVVDEAGRIRTSGAAIGTADNIQYAPDILSLLLIQSGVTPSNLSSNPEKSVEALDFYVSFGKGETRIWDTTLDPSLLAFSKGNLAMFFGYARDIAEIKAQNPALQFEIHAAPSLPDRKLTIASYWVEGISSETPHPKEALKLLKFLAQKDTQQKLYAEQLKKQAVCELYPRTDMADLIKENPLASPFLEQAPTAVSSPFSYDGQESGMNAELNGYANNAIREALGGGSSQSPIQTLTNGQIEVQGRYGM